MSIRDDEPFIRRVESLIDPAEVCDLYFFQRFRRLMPKAAFKSLLFKTSKRFPRIGFVIEPYSLFLFFKLKDLDMARSLLPPRYELIPSRISADDEPGYYHGMGIFNTKGSTFWGTRLESYLIARDKETGLVSWIFLDILSNTIIALPKYGVASRNCSEAMYTTNSKADIFVDVVEDGTGRRVSLKGNITRGVKKPMDKPLWIGGNTSIGYVERLSGGDDAPFAVVFDPAEVDFGLEIPLEDVELRMNTVSPPLAESELCKVLCFPFAQHYIADSPGCRTFVRDEAHMEEHYGAIVRARGMSTFTTRGIRRLFFAGVGLSVAGTVALLAGLIFPSIF
jgi:hypothetical protein